MDDSSGCGLTSEVSTGERESTPCFAASVALPGTRAPSQHSEGLSHFSVLKNQGRKVKLLWRVGQHSLPLAVPLLPS